jgi:hypothetical protein
VSRIGDSASVQAATQVNAVQASKCAVEGCLAAMRRGIAAFHDMGNFEIAEAQTLLAALTS